MGVSFLDEFMKINRQKNEKIPHGSAIFEDIRIKKHDFPVSKITNFEYVPHGSAIFERSL